MFQLVNETNEYEVFASYLRGNPTYVTYYIFWSKFLLVEAIPYFLIVILNSLIITKIWKSNKFRRRFVVSSESSFQVFIMLVVVSHEAAWRLVEVYQVS